MVHDNEILMKEVAELDAQCRQAVEERDAALAAKLALEQEVARGVAPTALSGLARTMEAQVEVMRSEREESARSAAADREFLSSMFTELEAQLTLARTEREEGHTRAERERKAANKRIRELEEQLAAATASKDKLREECEREKEVLAKQFEQRIAGLRLEREQAKLDKALMRRLEADLGELKALSASVLGPLAAGNDPRGIS